LSSAIGKTSYNRAAAGGERERRIVIAGFILHDFEKLIMSYFRKCLKVPGNAPRQKPGISVNYLPEHREIIDVFIQR